MAIAKRFSYSLLISTVAFAIFAVVAFSGLFPWIEAQFYSPKVVAEFQGRLDQASRVLDSWKKTTLGRLDKVLDDGAFDGVYSPTASVATLQKRYQSGKLFLLGLRGGGSLRFLNADRTQIHLSTEDSDVKARGDLTITYRFTSDVSGLPDLRAPGLDDGKAHVLPDADGRVMWFLRPWKDSQGVVPGFILLGVSLEDWRLALVEAGLALADQPITALGEDYLFSLLGRHPDPALVARVKELRTQGVSPPVQRIGRVDGQLTVSLIHKGPLYLLVPASALELDPGLKTLLLLSLYTVLFLIAFLVANLQGEPLSVVTRKVKRFQLQVVRQYLDLKEADKIQSLRDELARHSSEIRTDIRRSLGRVKHRDREWVDRYIDTSWQEVMDLLRGPSPPSESPSNADWKRLETLLQQALTQGRFVVSGAPAAGPAGPVAAPPKRAPAPAGDDVEELEELEDLDAEDVEDVEDVEDLEDAEYAEDVEEVEALDDADAVEEAEPVEDAEAVEELEELDPEEAEPVEDAEPVEALDEALDETVDDLEELEEASEADGEVQVVEALAPLDATAVFRKVQRPGADEPLRSLEAVSEEVADVEELEDLEEELEEFEASPVAEDASIPLERLDAAWKPTSLGVFEESGEVVSLKDEVFALASGGHDAFGHLVDEVMAGPETAEFVALEEDSLVPARFTREWRWTGAGFDWDRFALGADEVNLFRALSDVVTEFDAFTAAILTDEDGHWKAQSSVGFSDSGKLSLDFGPDSPMVTSFLSVRALHVLKGGREHPALHQSFHAKDMRFLKAMVCVPLLFHREPAWLLLGLRSEPGDLIQLLAPRRLG